MAAPGPSPADAAPDAEHPAGLRLVVTQLPVATDAERAGPRSAGSLAADWGAGARIVLVEDGRVRRVLTQDFASAADPDVSWDGTRVLFAGQRRAGDPWSVWETDVASGDVREVAAVPGGARSPVYLPTVHTIVADPTKGTAPREQVGFVRTCEGTRNEYGDAPVTALCSVRLDGTEPRDLARNLSNDTWPAVLGDGRIVYSSLQRATLDHGPGGRAALLAVNADGLDPTVFSADEGARVKTMPCVLPPPSRLVVFVEADALTWDGAGVLASVSLRRNLHSWRRITSAEAGLFHSPSALPDGTVLAARRPADGSGTHGIVRVDPATGRTEPVFDDPAWHDVEPRALVPRPAPDARSSAVTDPDAGPTGGRDAPAPRVAAGEMFAVDVRLNDLGEDLPAGTIRGLRILEGLPARAGDPPSPLAARRVVGEAPVEADGSFHVVVPSGIPLQVQIVDADGLALRSSGWIWVQYRAHQGCVGCHEDGERAPPNRFVDALAKPAVNLVLPPERRRRVDFERDVAPVVASRCVSCHGDGAAVRLTGPDVHATLLRFVDPGRARTSRLVWHLFGRNTARPWDGDAAAGSAAPMPEGAALTADERRLLVEWVDVGAPRATAPGASGAADPGESPR